MKYKRIVLNEPHASVEGLYDELLSFWNIDANFVNDVVLKWTDWHTDYLFHGYQRNEIHTVRFPYSRFIVDAERLWNDPLEEQGQGILYKQFAGYQRDIPKTHEPMLLNLWHQHQQRLKTNLCENALLLDCHSFPCEVGEVDICIGYNEDWSKPDASTLSLVVNLFEENGYTVGINNPYSNSETPECPFVYQSLMLEVNKRAYMEEESLRLKQPIQRKSIRDLMTTVLKELLNASEK